MMEVDCSLKRKNAGNDQMLKSATPMKLNASSLAWPKNNFHIYW